MRAVLPVLILAILTALSAPAYGQAHDHDSSNGMLLVISDAPPDGRTVVGDVTHFQYVLLDTSGRPFPHHDIHVLVELNGIPLYATLDAHDYDGVGGFDVVFPVPGRYNVTVEIPVDGGKLVAVYPGYVVPQEGAITAAIELDAPTTTTVGTATPFTYSVVDANKTLVPHSDALVQVRRLADDFVVLELHTHSHEDPMSFDYAFEKAGEYDVRFVGYMAYPDEHAAVFTPVVVHHRITVTGSSTPTYKVPDLPMGIDAEAEPGERGPYTTHIAADPVSGTDKIAGPHSQVRTSHVTYNATAMALVQHLDYEASLKGPEGLVFASQSLHEYDGVLTILSANSQLGDYTWTMKVARGQWNETRSYTYEVATANLPLQAGPQFIDVTGLSGLKAATAGEIGFFVHGAGGVPFMHSEVGFEVLDKAGLPVIAHKLHTHDTGTFAFQTALPFAGEHVLQVDPFDVHGAPTPRYYGKDAMSGRALGFSVAEGVWPTVQVAGAPENIIEKDAPGLPTLILIAMLALAASVGRRDRS